MHRVAVTGPPFTHNPVEPQPAKQFVSVPVLQMLHNFRIVCPSAILYRDGKVCEDCLGKRFAWPGIRHACYRGSRLGSAVVAEIARSGGGTEGPVALVRSLAEAVHSVRGS